MNKGLILKIRGGKRPQLKWEYGSYDVWLVYNEYKIRSFFMYQK